MSWWTQNRKFAVPALGLLALNMIPGAGQAAASAMGSLWGMLGAAPGSVGVGPALGASQALAAANSAVAGGINAALAAEGGSEAGLAGLDAVAKAKFGQDMAMPIGYAGNALSAVNKVSKPMMAANQVMGMAQGPQQAPPPRPPQSQFQPTPVNPAYGMGMDSPPPGIDPRQWAMMTPDQKRRFKGGY